MEIKMNEVMLAGRVTSDLSRLDNGSVHFLLDAVEGEAPVHCFCEGVTAENLLKFCERGDEISCEGNLAKYQFANQRGPQLLINVRFVSYGRKRRTLR